MIAKNRREARQQAAIIERRRAFIERWAQQKIKMTYREMGDAIAEAYEMAGMDRVKGEEDQIRSIMQGDLMMVYERCAKEMQSMARRSLKSFYGHIETKETDEEDLGRILDLILQDFAAEAFTQATLITQTMLADVEAAILADEELIRQGPIQVARAIRERAVDMSVYKSQLIARTEVGAAVNTSQDVFTKEIWNETEDGPLYKEWQSTRGARTRDDHKEMDGKIVPYDSTFKMPNGDEMRHPCDRRGKPENVCNCLLPDSEISFCHPQKLFRRHYVGEVFEIKLCSEHKLSVTPNHPILTDVGWKRACEIKEGDNLVVNRWGDGIKFVDIDVETANATVGQMYDSFIENGSLPCITTGIMNFHGDVFDSDVEVISVGGPLMDGGETSIQASFQDFALKFSESAGVCLVDDGAIDKFLFGSLLPTNGIMGGLSELLHFFLACVFESDDIRLASSSGLQSQLLDALEYCGSAEAQLIADMKDGFPLVVEFSDFINGDFLSERLGDVESFSVRTNGVSVDSKNCSDFISRFPLVHKLLNNFAALRYVSKGLAIESVSMVVSSHYDGPVYNIEDDKVFYAASTIINHNCRCSWSSLPEELVPERYRRN